MIFMNVTLPASLVAQAGNFYFCDGVYRFILKEVLRYFRKGLEECSFSH